MPLTPDFTASTTLSDLSEITLTDTSTGSNTSIVERRVYISLSNGQNLTSSGNILFTPWSYSLSYIALRLLARSFASNIRVDWVNQLGQVVNTKTKPFIFTNDDDLFNYELLNKEAANPALINDTAYYSNAIKFMADLKHAKNAVELAGDIAAAQNCLNRNHNKILHESKYF